MAPQERQLLGTRPTTTDRMKEATVDNDILLAQHAQHSPTDQEHKAREERNCFYCLEGWVFLGSLDHDGEEIVEAIRCKRCDSKGVLTEATVR